MKPSHEEYLKGMLASKQLHLDELSIQHRIHIAMFEDKKASLSKEINAIAQQLKPTDGA